MSETNDVSGETPDNPQTPHIPDIPIVSHKDAKGLKDGVRPPRPQKSARPRAPRRPPSVPQKRARTRSGQRPNAQHERRYVEVEAELDLATQSDPTIGAVDLKTKVEVSRLVDGTARARLMPELARMNSHEKILRVLSFTLLRLLRRKMYPDEANAITRLCSTAQKSLDLLGLTGKEAAALADLEPGPPESDEDIRKRINVPTEDEEGSAPPDEGEQPVEEPDTTITAGPVTTDEIPPADAADLAVPEESDVSDGAIVVTDEEPLLLDEDGDPLPIQKDMGPGD